jgi:hypothetical protein
MLIHPAILLRCRAAIAARSILFGSGPPFDPLAARVTPVPLNPRDAAEKGVAGLLSAGLQRCLNSTTICRYQFSTVKHPGRVELRLGRAPGSDQITARAVRRALVGSEDSFSQEVVELMGYFEPVEPGQRVQAVPGAGLKVPIWIPAGSGADRFQFPCFGFARREAFLVLNCLKEPRL